MVPPLFTGNIPRAGSATKRSIRMWERDESKIKLPWTRRTDGTPLTTPLVWHTNARPPTPTRTGPPRDRDDRRDDRRGRGGRDNDRRSDRRGRGGHGSVHFDTKDKGRPCHTLVMQLWWY